ncbi:HHR160Wp [Eremothecium sinecaudum]|uniref:HHR160Wp n=1 Tax=Eremothecium sinecaudum TaxID=45286 RepID=A0A0X8HWW1_9SACH|nr:HHR160Wp [Eremothecium sinecaudum]AMD22929.1 HHR160Wp [Eremothecium sinecaudum]
MSKRIADSQITRETFGNEFESNEATGKPTVASESTLRSRKIAMPKRSANGSSGGAFKNLFSFNKGNSAAKENTETAQSEQNAKIEAVNLQFRDKVVEATKVDPFVDLRPIFEKYKTYMLDISSATPSASAASVESSAHVAAASSDADSESDHEVKVEGPKFVVDKKPTTTGSVFSFGPKKKEVKDSDSESDVEIKGPVFKFDGNVSSDVFKLKKEEDKPAAPATKPTFSFSTGNSEKKAVDEKKNEAVPSFSFGAMGKKDDAPKPAFTFTAPSEKNNEGKSSFAFPGPAEKKNEQKTAFAATAGEKKDTKPSFTFGTSTTENTKPPSFSFGITPKPETSKPPFSFGANPPSFSFGTKKADGDDSKPASNFKFSLPFAQNSATLNTTEKQAESKAPNKVEDHAAEAKESNEEEHAAEPQSNLNMTNGEENEDALFSERAKLMIFDSESQSYKTKGLGELKVLQSKDDKSKVRILCRSEGMGHILLNTNIVKTFTYEPLGPENDDLIKCPVITEGKLETFVIRVKQKADGRKLVNTIASVQDSM